MHHFPGMYGFPPQNGVDRSQLRDRLVTMLGVVAILGYFILNIISALAVIYLAGLWPA